MATKLSENKTDAIPKQVFDQFIDALAEQNIPPEIIDRLGKTIISIGSISQTSIEEAMFTDKDIQL